MNRVASSFNQTKPTANSRIPALFVAWQNPETRRFTPVARLAQIVGDDCRDCFEFVYIEAAHEAMEQGFLPFLAFPELHGLYRARQLFPMFANRILPTSRPDFADYLEQLGLPPATSSPVLILSRSGGRRATDTLELFPLPTLEPGIGYQTWFWSHALRHLGPESHERIARLTLNERLYVMCDVQNPVDPMALALRTEDRTVVGYMPAYLLDDTHELLQSCITCEVYVERINPSTAPIQQRLLCRLQSCWPSQFVPYSTPRYQPLAQGAATVASPFELSLP